MSELNINHLKKAYHKKFVVNDISFNIKQGEIVGLLGPNGAGKTTTFYMVMGLVKPFAGEIFLSDQNITALPMYKRARLGIGYLAQEPSVFRKLTVEENLTAVMELLDIPEKKRTMKIKALLNELGIKHLADQKAYSLSGGERRRTEIARALVTDPKFLLLDEPFAGIDPKAVSEIQNMIIHLKNRGIGILITDHNVRETLSITDRAYVIYEGRILISGTADQLIKDKKAKEIYLGEKFKM
ncbi:MAG: LPS export ABC transporter ATP-binding protein [Spirochaetes bacterium]|nr:LPS export ABC transporter ATP-binding protein [Spirochaetota bacterium]